jgi:Predicted esterase
MNAEPDFTVDRFFDALYASAVDAMPKLADAVSFADFQRAQRARLSEVLGLDKLEAMAPGAPAFELISEGFADGMKVERLRCLTAPNLWTPFYVLHPHPGARDNGNRNDNGKSVLYLCGHGTSCEQVIDPAFKDDYQKTLPLLLARAGYTVFMPEFVGFGRTRFADFDECNNGIDKGCYPIATQLLLHGLTLSGMRIRQAMHGIAFARGRRPGAPLALAGISGGGLVAAFTAALSDDMEGCCISGYASTFKGSIMSLFHCVDNFPPGLLSVGEEPEIIALACPKPLFISNGARDPIFPIAETRKAIERIKRVYAKQGAEDKITCEIFEGGHEFCVEGLLPWLEKL